MKVFTVTKLSNYTLAHKNYFTMVIFIFTKAR